MEDRAVDEFHLRNIGQASTRVADDEPSIVRLLTRAMGPSKIPCGSESHKEPISGCRRRHISACRNGREKSVSKEQYSMSETASEKSSELGSNPSRHSIDLRPHRNCYFAKHSVAVIEVVNAYYCGVLEYCRYRISDRSQH